MSKRDVRALRLGSNKRSVSRRDAADVVLENDASLLDVVDNLLNKGVVVSGDVMLALAGVDLVYLQLSALLTAADRLFPKKPGSSTKRARTR